MKSKNLKAVIAFMIVMMASCDEPETVVTDIVHPDGSITRKIEMKNLENKFEISNIQVPFDSSWTVTDSIEISEKGDTTWVKRGEKFFSNIEELNSAYRADSGSNREFRRRVDFRKKFKWFHNVYRFAEILEKTALYGYPVSDFLGNEELQWFHTPDYMKELKVAGSDSLKYRALDDSVEYKTDLWFKNNFASEWINEFALQVRGKAGEDLTLEALKLREEEFIRVADHEDFDSLWKEGDLLKEFIGESNSQKFRTEADSALGIVMTRMLTGLDSYSQKISMPGKVIGTNGFVDSTGILIWPVKSDFNISEPYEMWAESKIPNKWAWIVTGAFILFVISGFVFRKMKRG